MPNEKLAITLSDNNQIKFTRPAVMGIVNCTPDSFTIHYSSQEEAISNARRIIEEGADILDLGGESSRPGSEPVSSEEELNRVIPVIENLRGFSNIPISIDTTKAIVAGKALTSGANIINDISAFAFDADMPGIAKRFDCPVIMMHIKGIPKSMQDAPHYDDVINEVSIYFSERIDFAVAQGIKREKLILDVGIGFGKRVEDNLKLIKYLKSFESFGLPLLLGASRKSFIGKITRAEVEDRVSGSLAVAAIAVNNGADIIRTHDVAQTRQAVDMAFALREA
ncbi:MAG: dihydropteroate synthase [candidate division Zixibacteria bacterium]